MARKLTQGSIIPQFQYDTPYLPQQSFYQLLDDDKPVMLVFLRNFGHPLSRHYVMEYIKTASELTDARLVCVVKTRPEVISQSIPENSMPYELICDAEGVLYDFFGVESENNWLKSYSFKALKILKEAKKQGFQENRSAPQQLPLTAVVGREGHVLFAHYGQSMTDMPEDCSAMQRVMEGLLAQIEREDSKKQESVSSDDSLKEGWQWEENPENNETEADTLQEAEPLASPAEDETLMQQEQETKTAKNTEIKAEEMKTEKMSAEEFSAAPLPIEQNESEEEWDQPLAMEADEPSVPTQAESKNVYASVLPGVAPRPKQKIDLAALGFLDDKED